MDAQNVHTASLYINNLLLARGLLRNGKSIEFAEPSKGEGGTDGTMARVINLVHDMILRRDREGEQRELMALNMRTLQSNETKQTFEIVCRTSPKNLLSFNCLLGIGSTLDETLTGQQERLQARNADLDRQLSLRAANERTFKTTLKTSESTAKGLREEISRLKTMLAQVRNQCATDVRKRDLQIQKLKTTLTTHQRGSRPPNASSTIVITPGVSVPTGGVGAFDDSDELASGDAGLRQETSEFLTQLCQSLTDENANILSLARSTLSTLQSLQGLSESLPDHMSTTSASPYKDIVASTDNVLTQLRSLLTNPAFVPIDELEARDEEIVRLREGWQKMEGRWAEAVAMMEHWRRKIEKSSGGRGVDLEELRKGLGFGIGMSPFKSKDDVQTRPDAAASALSEAEVEENDDVDMSDDVSMLSDDSLALGEASEDDLPIPRLNSNVLAELPHNKVRTDPKAARYEPKDDFTTIQEENTRDLRALAAGVEVVAPLEQEAGNRRRSRIPRQVRLLFPSKAGERTLTLDFKASSAQVIQSKLVKASDEAAQARGRQRVRIETATTSPGERAGIVKKPSRVRRRSGLVSAVAVGKGRRSRRRSTLTSEELESLIAGGLE
ncbi:MAG: hypothetical protein M1814_001814 [Vezdaea aestivalis]|nr:MAG: hypothetical protein M1814_001814 [Vezdaea aestivalis]